MGVCMSFRKAVAGICFVLFVISSTVLAQKNQIEKIDSFIVFQKVMELEIYGPPKELMRILFL
jgi:hypothetical protein